MIGWFQLSGRVGWVKGRLLASAELRLQCQPTPVSRSATEARRRASEHVRAGVEGGEVDPFAVGVGAFTTGAEEHRRDPRRLEQGGVGPVARALVPRRRSEGGQSGLGERGGGGGRP